MGFGFRADIADDKPDPGAAAVPKSIRYGIGVALFALAVGLPMLRQTGTSSWRTIWAEDGSVYFQDAYRDGGLNVLLRGYGGYLQLPPRLLGGLAELVPIRHLALYLAVSAQIVNALLASFVYWATSGWITSRATRLALASLVVLMPVLGFENTATITNTIWTFAAVTPWALVSLSERARGVALRCIVAFLAATATALTAIFVPLAIGYALMRRTRGTWVVVVAFCTGLLVQYAVVLHTADDRPRGRAAAQGASQLLELLGVRVFAQYLLGEEGIDALWDHRGLLVLGAPIVVTATLAALVPRADHRNQGLAACFVLLAVVSFVVPAWGRGANSVRLADAAAPTVSTPNAAPLAPTRSRSASRFSVVPVMTLAGAIGLLLSRSGQRRPRSTRRLCALVFVTHVIVLTMSGFSYSNQRSSHPSWSDSVERAYRNKCVRAPPAKLVMIAPSGRFLGFPVTVACGDLAS